MKKALSLTCVLMLVGCASIMHGPKQDIPVNTNPSGVTIEVLGRTYTSPATIELNRDDPPVTLKFTKEGYEPLEFVLTKKMDGWVWGNIIFGAIPGLIVDLATGSANQIVPETVQVTLTRTQAIIWFDIKPDGGLELRLE
ncbi:PEGA domain-containing protein [Gemmatimonadota bacterium]